MFGMDVAHSCASGMNGLRAAGDLVARLQMAKGMRIIEAKRYVADKLGVTLRDLSDNQAMHERRGELRPDRGLEALEEGQGQHQRRRTQGHRPERDRAHRGNVGPAAQP